jgi:23S rRNA maturation-related 3'-5' exoribonuclease YhaM
MKEEIKRLLLLTGRDGMDKLIEWMEQNGFFTAPCSGQFHLSVEGGLADHSLNVYSIAKELYEKMPCVPSELEFESIIIVSLLHDLGKAGQYGKPNYIPNMIKDGRVTKDQPEQKYKQSESKPFVTNPDLLSVPHEVRSIHIASQFIALTEDESFAILMHNGMYGTFKYELQGKETPLYLLLHMADMWCSRVIETEVPDGTEI